MSGQERSKTKDSTRDSKCKKNRVSEGRCAERKKLIPYRFINSLKEQKTKNTNRKKKIIFSNYLSCSCACRLSATVARWIMILRVTLFLSVLSFTSRVLSLSYQYSIIRGFLLGLHATVR